MVVSLVFIIMLLNVYWTYILIKIGISRYKGRSFEIKGDKAH
jgi:hypothetical protein